MAIKSTRPGGSYAGRGDVPHSDYLNKARSERAASHGIPTNWVSQDLKDISVTGRVLGYPDGRHITLSAESTGGGETDSHNIPFAHGYGNSPEDRAAFKRTYGGPDTPGVYGTRTVKLRAKADNKDHPSGLSWTMHPGDD
jgi:hypothetical protein